MKDHDNPQIRDILDHAAELPPERRSAFLDSACNGNVELRAEVESLLTHLGQEDSLLRDATVPPAVVNGDLPKGISSRPPPGEGPGGRIGRYKLLQLIGEGGFGSVFMAEQEHPVRRRVALKIIKLGMDTKQVIARFEAERQALAMMDHPNIARVLDAGTTETGRPYFVMDLVKGVPITEYCDNQNLSARERLELFVPVCQAVQHAHQKGIIHRDIKPSNVLVTLADGNPIPKIIDFGIAKATNARLTEQTCFTEFRQFIGTPQYMSPEQAEMSAIDIDTRSDIYSLGVLLYELLTGTTPLDARTLRSAAYEQVRRMIREVQPPRPSTRLSTMGEIATTVAKQRGTEPHRLGQLLRGELDWIVMKALEKDRTRRYDTAAGMAADVRRHLNNEPVLARPPNTMYAFQKFVSRHWVGAMAGSAVAAALVIGLALASYGLVRARAETSRADRARIEAQTQRDIAEKERTEARAEKKIADDQRQLAIENAKKATENARNAEVRLAQGVVSQADALTVAERFAHAHALYAEAYGKLKDLEEPLISAETGLCNLYHQAVFPLVSFSGHTTEVWCVALSPDGRTAVSGSGDGIIKIWDFPSGREIRSFSAHTGWVWALAFAPDGRTAVSASHDKTLKVWEIPSGKLLRTFTGHTGPVWGVAIAPDGRIAISAEDDGMLKVWELASGKELRSWRAHLDWANAVAISPNGQTALSGGHDRALKLWDLKSGNQLRSFTGHKDQITCVGFVPGGQSVLSGGFDHTLKLWDSASGQEIRTLTGHSGVVNCIAIAASGRTALSGSDDSTMKLWDLTTGEVLRTFAGHTDYVNGIAIAPDGYSVLSAGDTTLKLWELGRKTTGIFTGHLAAVGSVAVAPDGRTALSASDDKTLKLWDLATGKSFREFVGHTDSVNAVAIAPDGRTALSGSSDHTLKLWDLTSGKEIRTFAGHTAVVCCVAIAPDGRTAISGSRDQTLKLWDLASGRELRSFVGHTDWVRSVAIAPESRTAISASSDQTIKLWNLDSGKEIRTFTWHLGPVCSIAIAPNGQTALSGGADDTLKSWDLVSGQELHTFTGHAGPVRAIAVAPDGRIATSASDDGTVKLWDLTGGKEIRTFAGHSGSVSGVAFAPNGRIVISCSADRTLRVWDFDRGPAQSAFETRVAAAQQKLKQNNDDPSALLTLGEWFAFRGADQRAVDLLTRARNSGATVSPLMFARCYWRSDRLLDARREFQLALEESKDAFERTYLSWCIDSVEREAQRQRQNNSAAVTGPEAGTVK